MAIAAMKTRIHMSPPHMSGHEAAYVQEAFDTNWIAPAGPHLAAFEQEFCAAVGASHAAAVASGSAALHLALLVVGVKPGDEVLAPTFTFAASANPVLYLGGRPTFIDSDAASWHMDPQLLVRTLAERDRQGRLPAAVVVAHLYGLCADLDPIVEACARFEVPMVEDAAAAVGVRYKGRSPGTFGRVGAFSFNGNKIITTSGGGMVVSADSALVAHARKLATQAREPEPHFEHVEVGYNYRLSNLLAAVGRGQLKVLEERVAARRRNFDYYVRALGDLPGINFMPELSGCRHTRWLTTMTIDPARSGVDRETIRLALDEDNIESRPLWKPLHAQPVFSRYERVGGAVADQLFAQGLCLPSGSNLNEEDLERIVLVIRRCFRA